MRRNVNRGYRKLNVWQRAIDLYVLISKSLGGFRITSYKLKDQIISASASIHANIAEGFCRRSIHEYLNFLNYSLGSLGELGSYIEGCHRAEQIDDILHEEMDALHYEVENKLLKLIEALEKKRKKGEWQTSTVKEPLAEYITGFGEITD